MTVFCQIFIFCVVVPRVLRIWENFLYHQVFFTLHSFPTFGISCFYQGPAVLPWTLHGFPLRFETQTWSICLFETYSLQQKVLEGRFYLSIYVLRSYKNYYKNFFQVLIPLFNSYTYYKAHVISTKPQKLIDSDL